MENIIFAALLYILVPAFLLWLNREPSLRSQFGNLQLRHNARTTDLPHQSITTHNITPAKRELDLTSRDYAEARLGLRPAFGSQHTNPIQKTSNKKVLPTIEGERCVVPRRIPNHLVEKLKSKDTEKDYHQLNIRQLKKIAQKRKIKRYGNMRKQDLILALTS